MAVATYTAREMRILKQFRGAWLALAERALFRNPPRALSIDIFGIERTELKGVNEEELRSFLIAYRQFLLPKDASNFERTCAILRRGSRSENLTGWVEHAEEIWESTHCSSFGLTINGKDRTVRESLDLLHYGDIVHRDADKVAELEAMPKQDHAFLRICVLDLWPTLDALNIIGRIIRHIDENDVDSIPLRPPVGNGRQPPRGSFGQIVDS